MTLPASCLLRALVALAVLSFAGPLLAGEKPIVPPRDEAELRRRLEEILAAHHVPGMGLAVADRGGLRWAAGFGKANVKTGAEVTTDTLFRVGSISKMFVGLAAVKLASEGKLDLQASVRSLVPEVTLDNPWEATDPVRVVHLMEHTAGLDDISAREWQSSDPRPVTLREGLEYDPRWRRSRWRPGTRYSYSNAGPAVAAYVIEKIVGRRFEDYVAETFFAPLGMKTATFFLTPESDRLLTRLYREDGRTEYEYFHFLLRPSGSLNASPAEMSRFLGFLIDRGKAGGARILEEAALDRTETPTTYLGAQAGLRTGYGLGNDREMHDDGFVWQGHNGGLDGTRSALLYLPAAGVGYFCSINVEDGGAIEEIGELLRAYLIQDLRVPDLPPVVDPGPGLPSYAGFYELVSPQEEWLHFAARFRYLTRVDVSAHGLSLKGLADRDLGDYLAVSPTLYRRPENPEASLALLAPGPEGRLIQTNRMTFRALPRWLGWTQIGVIVLALLLMISTPLFALVWIPRTLAGRMKGVPRVPHLAARLWPLLAVLAFTGTVVSFYSGGETFGTVSPASVGFCAGTVLFAIFSLVSLVTIARVPRREVSLAAYLHTLSTSAVLSVVTVYLLSWGVIGFRAWR